MPFSSRWRSTSSSLNLGSALAAGGKRVWFRFRRNWRTTQIVFVGNADFFPLRDGSSSANCNSDAPVGMNWTCFPEGLLVNPTGAARALGASRAIPPVAARLVGAARCPSASEGLTSRGPAASARFNDTSNTRRNEQELWCGSETEDTKTRHRNSARNRSMESMRQKRHR